MKRVTSKDGTTITYDQVGAGKTVVLVHGATQHRAVDQRTAALADLLAAQGFSAVHYDRRGRGDSTDTLPFAVEREIEDIDALVAAAGGTASLFGMSSGGALALEAALRLGAKVEKLAIYEVPYNDDATARHTWKTYRLELAAALATNRPGDAVALFMQLVGMPAEQIAGMRHAPFWQGLERIAPTLAYDAAALGDEASVPLEHAAHLGVPTLLIAGSVTYPFMHESAQALANATSQGQYRVLEGQAHDFSPDVLAPVLVEFFSA